MKTIHSTILFAAIAASQAAPPNDNFADRIVIASVPVAVAGTTVDATVEPNEPLLGGTLVSSTVWYEWTAPAAGILVVRISDCTNRTYCNISSGNSLTNLGNLLFGFASSDFGANTTEARVRVEQGTVYQLQVAAYQTSSGPKTESPFTLRLDLIPPPPNDHFADRIVIPSVPAAVRGTTLDGTLEPGEPLFLYQLSTVWYEWVAPRSGILRVRITDTPIWMGIPVSMVGKVFSGNVLTQLCDVGFVSSTAGSGPDEANIDVQQAVSYQFQIWNDQSTPYPRRDGPFTLRLEYNEPPPNDHFTNRIRLTNSAERVEYRAVGATPEPGETQFSGKRSVWYQWRAPESGTARIWCDGAVGVYAGTEESRVALLTNAWNGLSFPAVAGQIYHLAFNDCGTSLQNRPFTHSWTLSLNGASLLNLNRQTNGKLNLKYYGDSTRSYSLETSTNLLDWASSDWSIQIDPANYRQRFYRARLQ